MRNKIGSKRARKCVMFVVEQCTLEWIMISNFSTLLGLYNVDLIVSYRLYY